MIAVLNFALIFTDSGYNMCDYRNIFTTEKRIIMVADSNDDVCNHEKLLKIVIIKLIINILIDIIMTMNKSLQS